MLDRRGVFRRPRFGVSARLGRDVKHSDYPRPGVRQVEDGIVGRSRSNQSTSFRVSSSMCSTSRQGLLGPDQLGLGQHDLGFGQGVEAGIDGLLGDLRGPLLSAAPRHIQLAADHHGSGTALSRLAERCCSTGSVEPSSGRARPCNVDGHSEVSVAHPDLAILRSSRRASSMPSASNGSR